MLRLLFTFFFLAPVYSNTWVINFNNRNDVCGDRTCAERGYTPAGAQYIAEPVGQPETFEYRVFIRQVGPSGSTRVSPFHDIPMKLSNGAYSAVTEIPQWTRAKYEVTTDEQFNPIFQDVKNGALRYYAWGDIAFNYGMIPQTYEDPNHLYPTSDEPGAPQLPGDGDPVDMIEIGVGQLPTGAVSEVRVLGALALIDDGEMDWKVATVRLDNPLANYLHTLEDVMRVYPGALEEIAHWWKVYKVAAGGEENTIGFGGGWLGAEKAKEVLATSHQSWRQAFAN